MSSSVIPEVLSLRNEHPRDNYIVFIPQFHTYKVLSDPDNSYVSVTTFLKPLFPPFNADDAIGALMNGRNWNASHECWGMSRSQIKQHWNKKGAQSATNGTLLHAEIEGFMNNPTIGPDAEYTHQTLHDRYFADHLLDLHDNKSQKRNAVRETKEWDLFLRFVQDHPEMKPYRTEWVVYDEEVLIAGSIDMVYENADGTLSIFDWKRVQSKKLEKTAYQNRCAIHPSVSHLPDTNYWKYALQLNVYRAIIQRNYGKIVSRIALVRLLHEEEDSNYEIVECPMLDKEVESLFQNRIQEIAGTRKPMLHATAVSSIAKVERFNPSRASVVLEQEKETGKDVNSDDQLVDTESEEDDHEDENDSQEEDLHCRPLQHQTKERSSGAGGSTGEKKPVFLMRLPQYQAHAQVTNKYIKTPIPLSNKRTVPSHVLAAAQVRAKQTSPSLPPRVMQSLVSSTKLNLKDAQVQTTQDDLPCTPSHIHPLRRRTRIRNLLQCTPIITTTLRRSARLQAMRQENRIKSNL